MLPTKGVDWYYNIPGQRGYAAWSTAKPGQWLRAEYVDGSWQIIGQMSAKEVEVLCAAHLFWGMKLPNSTNLVLVMVRKSQYTSNYRPAEQRGDSDVSLVRV